MTSAIEISNVSKSFRRYLPDRPFTLQEVLARGFGGLKASERFWALRDVSVSVRRGKATGIIGTNGSGKSTLLRLVGGIGTVDRGHIHVAGRIGALLDLGSGINPDLTGRENVIVAGVLSGLTRREVLRRFDDIVAFAELEKFIDNPMRTYSSGMQMRLAFAINVHTDPDVLLIDEVLAVGDASFQHKCLERIKQFKANGCSLLLVSHGLTIVQQLCDDVVWLNKGQLMAHGAVNEVAKQYQAHVGHAMEPEPTGAPAPTFVDLVPAAFAVAAPPDPSADAATNALSGRILQVSLLDATGHPFTTFPTGQALHVAIDFDQPAQSPPEPIAVRIVREDGLLCCDVVSDQAHGPPSAPWAGGPARITFVFDRLDLNSGHYSVDVRMGSGADGTPGVSAPGCALVVQGEGARDAVLAVPHRWELDA